MGVKDTVQQMREMAAGSDLDVAEFMIQDIFEEYPFFGQYPLDKLRTTACLMGSLIAQAVFKGRSLFVGLRLIVECFEVRSKTSSVPDSARCATGESTAGPFFFPCTQIGHLFHPSCMLL